jgi:hypothetical protein
MPVPASVDTRFGPRMVRAQVVLAFSWAALFPSQVLRHSLLHAGGFAVLRPLLRYRWTVLRASLTRFQVALTTPWPIDGFLLINFISSPETSRVPF